MKLILNNHKSSYQIQSLFQMFYPLLTWKFENKVESSFKALKPLLNIDDEIIITSIFTKKNCCFIIVYIKIENKVYFKRKKLKIGDENYNYWFCNLIYDILSSHTERLLPWGFYTGVRPVKTVNDYLKTNNNNIKKVLIEKYNITDSKMDLAIQTASYQNEILLKQEKEYYSLFIFIPFCPSRCKYCSFVSNSISKTEKIENEYINNLIKELEFTAQNINKTSKIIHTIYVGGGTPTSISDDQLLKLVKKIKELFLKNLNIEYTFEAGRADSITKKKLEILKEYGVNRISINPQTFNDTVLKKIKRNHTSKEVVDTFEIARNVGFNNINMDFIAGLGDETFQSFQQSLIKGCSLNPENITIHTLAIKKSAQLKQTSKVNDILSKENLVQQMVDFSQKYLYEKGYHPYYLYRQKNTIGNFENVGFSKQGFDCVYNIIIMEEIETIIACGAGASSKIITDDFNNKKQIKRIYNYKYPFEYNNNFQQIIKRKKQLFTFLKNDL